MTLVMENHLFAAEQTESIVLIRLKGDLIHQLTDLNLKEGLFAYLHNVRNAKSIKAVLFLGSREKMKRRKMIEFLCEMAGPGKSITQIARVYNAINQLILFIRSMNKLVIHADSGEVLSLFMNISLACDYRIIGDKTVFQYPTSNLGLVPKGGGLFFLSRSLGAGKALELLLSGRDIPAAEALALKIVDKVVASETLEEEALMICRQFVQKPAALITGIKTLLNTPFNDLASFLEKENELLLERIKAEDFDQYLATCD